MRVGKTITKGVGRRRAVPWVLLGLWVAALALVGPFAGKLGQVQHDRATDYLPMRQPARPRWPGYRTRCPGARAPRWCSCITGTAG